MRQRKRGSYFPGTIPIKDSIWEAFTVENNHFKTLGTVLVKGADVSKEMDEAHSIKGHEPATVARRIASQKWDDVRGVILIKWVD